MMRKLQMVAMALLVTAAAGVATAESEGEQRQQIQIEGSNTVGPIMRGFAEAFMEANPNVNVTVKATGSGDGAAALVDGRCDVAAMSRFMRMSEFLKALENDVMPVAHTIAMDGICVVLHPSNPVGELTMDQIKGIYTGDITNWRQLGGVDMQIVPLSRDTNSGTYGVFSNIALDDDRMSSGVEYVASNQQMHQRVSSTQGAIGFVGVGFLDREVKAVRLDGVLPNRRTIATAEYPLVRALYVWTNGYPKLGSMLHRFVAFYLTEAGQDIVEEKGFVPLTNY